MKKIQLKKWSFYLLFSMFFFIGLTVTINKSYAYTTPNTDIYLNSEGLTSPIINCSSFSFTGYWSGVSYDYPSLTQQSAGSVGFTKNDICGQNITHTPYPDLYNFGSIYPTDKKITIQDSGGFGITLYSINGLWYDNPILTDPTLRFLNITNPTGNFGSSTTLYFGTEIPFDFSYYSNSTSSISLNIIDNNTGTNVYFWGGIRDPGSVTINQKANLIQDSTSTNYQANIYISNENENISTTTNFTLINNTNLNTPFQTIGGVSQGTSTTPDSTNLLSFLNVPKLMQEKIPFGYIFQIAGIIKTGINSSTTDTLTTGTIHIKLAPNIATTTIDLFSANTIKDFMTQPFINLFRGLEVAFLWFECLWFLYHDAKSRKIF